MATSITAQVDIIPQPGCYLSLKDDLGTVWSLRFKTEEDLLNATRAIALARSANWGQGDGSDGEYFLVQQDAVVGPEERRGAARGDGVSVRYCVWLESTNGRGVLGEALAGGEGEGGLAAEFALGHNEVIKGWEEGVSGMRAGGVRWLVVPPHMAYGEEGKQEHGIPPAPS